MSKDLKDVLDNIESSEKQTAILQSKVDKLTAVVGRQKKIVSEQEAIIEEQKAKISKMSDVPEDILELKELIVVQRQQLNEKELELEYSKAEVAQAQKELELVKKQIVPSQKKLEESYENIGNLRAELAEKNSEIILKNEEMKALQNKIQELEAFTDKFKEEQVKLISEMEEKHRKETQELKTEVGKLDSILLDSKLVTTEKDSEAKDAVSRMERMKQNYEDLISKVGELSDKNREANEEIERLNTNIEETYEFQKANVEKIHFYDKLKPLMEKETLFKTFLIVENVGGITLEDQIFKVLALGSPYVKAIGMARAPLTAAMVGKTVGQRILEGELPVYYGRFGDSFEEIFVETGQLKTKFGNRSEDLPAGAIGLYTYFQRLVQGLKQLMCGARKFALSYITRDDIAALTPEAARISGIKYIMDLDKEDANKILEEKNSKST